MNTPSSNTKAGSLLALILDRTDPSLSLEVQTTTPVGGFFCFTLVSISYLCTKTFRWSWLRVVRE